MLENIRFLLWKLGVLQNQTQDNDLKWSVSCLNLCFSDMTEQIRIRSHSKILKPCYLSVLMSLITCITRTIPVQPLSWSLGRFWRNGIVSCKKKTRKMEAGISTAISKLEEELTPTQSNMGFMLVYGVISRLPQKYFRFSTCRHPK